MQQKAFGIFDHISKISKSACLSVKINMFRFGPTKGRLKKFLALGKNYLIFENIRAQLLILRKNVHPWLISKISTLVCKKCRLRETEIWNGSNLLKIWIQTFHFFFISVQSDIASYAKYSNRYLERVKTISNSSFSLSLSIEKGNN